MLLTTFIETVFGLGLFINAALFIPQIIQLYKTKNPQGLSLVTFAGFNLIQLFTILHGVLSKDYLLIIGFTASLISCGTVTLLLIKYKLQSRG